MRKIMDGNEACANIAYLFSESIGIYPITPSSPMATLCSVWSSEGKNNILGYPVNMIEMQSEAGSSALFHGLLQAGSLSTTFTSSQGLLLMIPSMYKIAGELLPGVIHVAARTISTHALSIYGDHSDIYAARSTGFAFLSSSSVEEAYHMALIAHLSSLSASIPFVHFFDGFRTSHEINVVNTLEEGEIKKLVDYSDIKSFKNRAFNIHKNITRGTAQTEDIFFQMTESRNIYYDDAADIVNEKMEALNKIAGTNYKPFTFYGSEVATKVIVAMGSVSNTIKQVIDNENKKGNCLGLITVHLFRPFSKKYFLDVLPKTTEKIAVLDRAKEHGSAGEALYLDVKSVIPKTIEIVGGRYGLSSKNTTPADIKAVFDNLEKEKMKDNFTLGIEDDVTNLSLKVDNYKLPNNYKEVMIYGFGSDGSVSASKNILKTIGQNIDKYVEGYFNYDSKKSGGVTISHLRVSDDKIEAPYYITNPDIVVVNKLEYLNQFDIVNSIKKKGTLILNSNKVDSEINKLLNNEVKEKIKGDNIKFFIVKADKLSEKYNLNGKINNIISTYLLKMLGCSISDFEYFKNLIKETYKDKGEKVTNNNLAVIEEAPAYLRMFDQSLFTFEKQNNKISNDIIENMLKRKGEELKVSAFMENPDGTFIGGTSVSDRYKISEKVSKWNSEKCITCNLCTTVCPHSVIRPFLLTKEDLEKYGIKENEVVKTKDKDLFYMAISENNCTGCSLCKNVCPSGAIEMYPPNDRLDKISNRLFNYCENDVNVNKYSIKGLGFKQPGIMFPGACAGCGEVGYLKLLTQLFKDNMVISNATGCSSIYGGSLPKLPYNIPWINSLFEDNAEFALGLLLSYKQKRNRIKEIMFNTRDEVSKDMKDTFKNWILNMNDDDITNEIYLKLKENSELIDKELKDLLEYIPSRDVWAVGGDGWAYDIGYGGLDHVLYTNENIKVLILDSEVYSNTGGQTSKSSKEGSTHEFAPTGKKQNKKDLFKILMSIPNIYIASISLKANPAQSIKAFKEAHEHNGPSVIIAYSPCIEHGITGGLSNSHLEEKLLVESGYNILMRYKDGELFIDSKDPDFSLYEEIFSKELRYKKLKLKNNEYKKLLDENIDNAKKRYEYYKKISVSKN